MVFHHVIKAFATETLASCSQEGPPGGPAVANLPSVRTGAVGLIPVQETESPHAAGQLSLHAKTAAPESRR